MKRQEPSLPSSIFGILIIVAVLFAVFGSGNKKTTSTLSQEYTQEQKQNIMKLTNDFANEGISRGFIKEIEKGSDGTDCVYIFWVEEKAWENMPYKDKQGANELIKHYSKVRGCYGAAFKGYRTGKYLK